MTRMRRLQMTASVPKGLDNGNASQNGSPFAGTPVAAYIKQLSQLKSKAPLSMRNTATLNLHYLIIEMHVDEWPLSPESPSDGSSTALKSLHSCLSAAKSFFGILFSMPPVQLFEVTFITQLHVAHALIALFRLFTFVYPGWELEEIRSSIDLAAVVGDFQTMLEAARNVFPNSDLVKHVFTRTVRPLQAFKGLLDRPNADPADDIGLGDLPAMNDIDFDFETLLAGLDMPMWM